jgi:asparagine synthase (glutamine-hydrolysing)
MCGFFGNFDSSGKNKEILDSRYVLLNHRGPDSTTNYVDNFLRVKFFRLKILGGDHGNQPMISFNKKWLMIFNGEIYNYVELANMLGKSYLIKFGDTRVLIEFISDKGLAYLNKLNGMFSIVLFNLENKKIYFIRDRFGVKPLYYTIDKKNILHFSSEIKSIFFTNQFKIKVNESRKYLDTGMYPDDSDTFFENIYEFRPGTLNTFEKGSIKSKSFYNLESAVKKKINKVTFDDFEECLERAIKIRFRSDVPINLNFSGGVDSTALLIKIKEIFGWRFPVNLFCVGFKKYVKSDFIQAEKIANFFKLKLNKVYLDEKEIPFLAKKVQFFLDEPYGGISLIASYKLNEVLKKKGIVVSLEGQGGDEIFGGYNSHVLMAINDMNNNNNYELIRNNLINYLGFNKKNIVQLIKQFINSGFSGATDLSLKYTHISDKKIIRNDSWLRTIAAFDIYHNKMYRNLRFQDRVSAGCSRELRFPLLDFNVVETGLAMSLEQKFLDGFPKYPLRKILLRYLPNNYILKNKNSINIPQTKILNTTLKYWSIKNINQLNKKFIFKEKFNFNKYFSKKNSFKVWQLINLNIFFDNLKKIKKNISTL